jgi:SOS-response transcriptional repressor LexA
LQITLARSGKAVREAPTKRQRELLDFIRGYHAAHDAAPSYEEMCAALGVGASTVAEHLASLEQKGWILRPAGRGFALELLDDDDVAKPAPSNDYDIPPNARYVPVSALPGLFRRWLDKRQAW